MDGLVRPVDFLLPNESIDLKKWAVVACDQFTSQPEYWERLGEFTKGSPSVLNIIYPEVYLADRTEERIEKINKTISEYLSGGVFRQVKDSYILISRDTVTASGRLGLLASIDLEKFDFRPFSKAPVKATEETVLERIPPRLKIRKNAELELPHIILLIDDPDMTVLEPLYAGRDRLEKLYDTELNMSGGRVEGYRVKDTAAVNAALSKLL
ncbi:MAG TPA: DUF1015 family protein, partial [Eubacteriales bacterium]|nr:DUF1015 family protein [Eubacteriales bacterium]